jgi:hypothetical protein
MIEVQRMTARDEGPIIEEGLPGSVGPEQSQGHPQVPADQGAQGQEPEPALAVTGER